MSFSLPFIQKNKRPRVATPEEARLPEEKVINGSPADELVSHCFQELMDAVTKKDPYRFRQAVSALVMNLFQEPDATDHRQIPEVI